MRAKDMEGSPVKSILLVDDDQDDKYFFATALEEVDGDVRLSTAAEGVEALEKLKTMQVDLVLVDLVMPGMNGISLLKAIKSSRKLKNLHVVVYTSDLSIFKEQDLLRLGASQVVLKANDYPGTIELISTLLGKNHLKQTA